MNCLIVDDDELSRRVIEDLVQDNSSLTLVKSCEDAMEAIRILKDSHVDLLFLDIEMPKISGMELIQNLDPLPQVIFVTSHSEYAVESYEYDVTDFVQKPINPARFMKAVQKAEKKFESNRATVSAQDGTVFIKTDSKLVRLDKTEILWIEALGNYMRIFTKEKKYTILSTMKEIAEKLSGDEFVRVHRSYMVRLDKILSIEDNYIVINNKQISIGKAYKERLGEKLNML